MKVVLLALLAVAGRPAGAELPPARPLRLETTDRLTMDGATRSAVCSGALAPVDVLFNRLDLDRDRRLSGAETGRFVREPAGLPLDLDADGFVSVEEFRESFVRTRESGALRYGPRAVELMALARGQAAAGVLSDAVASYAAATEAAPECGEAWLGLGLVLAATGEPRRAAGAFRRAVEESPQFAAAWLELGLAAYRERDLSGARQALTRAVTLFGQARNLRPDGEGPDEEEPLRQAALARIRQTLEGPAGRPLARELLLLADDWPAQVAPHARPSPETARQALCAAGRLARDGRSVEALARLTTVAAAAPAAHDWKLARASLLIGQGNPGLALECLAEAQSSGAPGRWLRWLRAAALLAAGRRDEAAAMMTALGAERFEPWERMDVAWGLAALGEWRLALQWAEIAAATHYETPMNRLLVALAHEATGDRQRAVELLRQFSPPLGGDLASLRLNAWLCRRLGLYGKAVEAASAATRLEPGQPAAWLALAEALRLAGDPAGELRTLRKALVFLPPGAPCRARLQARLAELESAPAARSPGASRPAKVPRGAEPGMSYHGQR
jgi:tetratricopeptide (TPR) repeat protein